MTKEEFYNLANNRPKITGDSIYKLTVREHRKDVKGYEKDSETKDWYYPISLQINWYTSKQEAEKYLHDFIKGERKNHRNKIHSAVIERIPANITLEDGGQLEWWFYNSAGEEIDRSACAWEINKRLSLRNVYLGRKPEEIRFEMGDIVEIIQDDKAFLSVINGLPPTIEEMWELYVDGFKRNGKKVDEKIAAGEFSDAMKDIYFYIQSNGFDPDEDPYHIVKPIFEVPREAKDQLAGRYHRWKSYIDKHSYDEINWTELQKLVKS